MGEVEKHYGSAPDRRREAQAVVCVGAALWDVIARADGAAAGADMPGRVVERPGGVAANVAMGLARAGLEVHLVAAIGGDPSGRRLGEAIASHGVHVTAPEGVGHTDRYVAIEDESGLVAAVADTRALDAIDLGDVAWPVVGAWFVEANLPAGVLVELVESAPPLVFADAVSVAKAPRLRPVLGRLRGLYANRAEAEAILGRAFDTAENAARALVAAGPTTAIVTDGPRPAAMAGQGGVVTATPPKITVRSVTGAGDGLAAAHLAATLAGAAPRDALAAGIDAARERIA